MKYRLILLTLLVVLMFTGCYLPLGGRVIDAKTNEPIEGAFVLALWTTTHSAVHKIAETTTNKKGEFSMPVAYSPFVNKPSLMIYKQGYVGWRSDSIYTAAQKEDGRIENRTIVRSDYSVWQFDHVYALERFEEGYSRLSHFYFLGRGVLGALEKREASQIKEAITSELKSASMEQEEIRRRP